MQVFVRDNDINTALRVVKRNVQRDGTFRDMKRRRAHEKPSERCIREKAEAIRRHRKMLRKRLEREGY
jgi:small subunit ribosomal protein S21